MNYHGNSLKIFAELCSCGNSLTFLDILGNNSDPKLIMGVLGIAVTTAMNMNRCARSVQGMLSSFQIKFLRPISDTLVNGLVAISSSD